MKLFADKLHCRGIDHNTTFFDLFNAVNDIVNNCATHIIPINDKNDGTSYIKYSEMATKSNYSTKDYIQAVYVDIVFNNDTCEITFSRTCITPLGKNGIIAKIYPLFCIAYTDNSEEDQPSMYDGGSNYIVSVYKYDTENRKTICDNIDISIDDKLSILNSTELRCTSPEHYNLHNIEEIYESLGIKN